MIRSISHMFPPTLGNTVGKCVVCGENTQNGHKIDFSERFTSWSLLTDGDCICEHCYTLCRDQQYRRKSWVVTPGEVTFLTRKDVIPVLLNPPDPPFSIYITKSGKKQGFLHLINKPALSRNRFFIAFEDTPVFVDRGLLKQMVKVAEEAKAKKFKKSDMIDPSVKCWEHRDLCETILKFRKNPLWEVVVYGI